MSLNACLMVGKQVGVIGILTTLAKNIDILSVVAYDDITSMISNAFHIPTYQTIHDRRFVQHLVKSDFLICVHGREIIPPALLSLPKCGCINVHPCLYKYKGKNPIQRLLDENESKASIGVHYMTEKIDEGAVIIEEYVDVHDLKTVENVYNTLYPYYALVLSKALDIIEKQFRSEVDRVL